MENKIGHYSCLTTISLRLLLSQEPNNSHSSTSSYKYADPSSVKSQQQSNKGETTELFHADGPSDEPRINSYLQGLGTRTQLHR